MEDALKEALELVKAQARVRPMTEDEMILMTKSLASNLNKIIEQGYTDRAQDQTSVADPAKHIREKSITCLECGKSFKTITAKHLQTHGLDRKAYLEKWSLPKGTALTCKSLARDRRKKMKELELWKRRGPKGRPKS